jgi:hypothetical protein
MFSFTETNVEKFSLQRLEKLMSDCAGQGEDMDLDQLGLTFLEVCKLLG